MRKAKHRALPGIWRAAARVDDKPAMDRLLSILPRMDVELTVPGDGAITRLWDKHTRRDFWLASDGEVIMCITIQGLNAKQSTELRMRFDQLGDEREFGDIEQLAAVMSSIGVEMDLIPEVRQ
jgi:hypothetical protein